MKIAWVLTPRNNSNIEPVASYLKEENHVNKSVSWIVQLLMFRNTLRVKVGCDKWIIVVDIKPVFKQFLVDKKASPNQFGLIVL